MAQLSAAMVARLAETRGTSGMGNVDVRWAASDPGLRRMAEVQDGGAFAAFVPRMVIAVDEYAAQCIREGKTLREVGLTALADALAGLSPARGQP